MSKHSTGTYYIHKFQNTKEISHIFVHQSKFPNHDKLKTPYIVKIHKKNYSIIHVILNQNKACQLKVTNLVKL